MGYRAKVVIVCVYNDKIQFERMRQSALRSESFSGGSITAEELVVFGLDNTNSRYPSAAEAYNYALNQVQGEVICFAHQDIIFDNRSLSNAYRICRERENCLFGYQGVKQIVKASERRNHNMVYSTSLDSPIAVFALDEGLIVGNTKVFSRVMFDPVTCDNWHFYVVDLCLQCHEQQIPVMTYDARVQHLSDSEVNAAFYITEKKIIKKWRHKYKILTYTCGWTYTDSFRYTLLRVYRKMRGIY